MPLPESASIDLSEARARALSIGAGVRLALATSVFGWIYAAATWSDPDRRPLMTVFGLWAVLALGACLLRRDRLAAGRRREPFFLVWSAASIALTAAAVAVDGGADSPLTVLFFLPIVFAGLSYPAPSVGAVAVTTYLAYLAVGLFEPVSLAELSTFAFVLGAVAALCVWQGRDQNRRRDALSRVSRADPLTGCLNQRGFEERMDAELSRAARTGRPLGIVLLDMGEAPGGANAPDRPDELLGWALEVMAEAVRPMDSIGRLDDLRFGIVVPGAGRDDTAAIARRLRDALAERAPVAAGVACFPADGVDRAELEEHAEQELEVPEVGAAAGRRLERRGGKELSWATTLARAVDERMSVQHEHSWRVSEYAVAIADRLAWPDSEKELLRMAAILHDVGKVTVPDHILRKRDPLTAREWEAIRRSPVRGAEMVGRIAGLEAIVPWIRHSHERYDGSGYPSGLMGDAIPPACRVLHVADAFDAMRSGRPYREPMTVEEALTELRMHAGTQFDPECVERLQDYVETPFEAEP
jgi:diguanylate cyclase (GGDEF)-like protein